MKHSKTAKAAFLIMALCVLLITGTAAAEEQTQPDPCSFRVIGYVLVTAGDTYGWLPVPDEGEYLFPLKQVLQDGTEAENVIHVSSEGVWMESSTCDNQDCVTQGMVTFGNMNRRILQRMIICLPHRVTLELYTAEEVSAILAQTQSGQ